jgi:hypothetical protein
MKAKGGFPPPSPSLFLLFFFSFPPSPFANTSHEAPIKLGFFLALSVSLEAFYVLSCLLFVLSIFATQPSWILIGFCVQVFELRFTHQLQLRCVTRLSAVLPITFCRSSSEPPHHGAWLARTNECFTLPLQASTCLC